MIQAYIHYEVRSSREEKKMKGSRRKRRQQKDCVI
jgi:hypothetical protein